MRRILTAAWALVALIPAGQSQAALAPKFERSRALSEALKHLNEIAHLLNDPIDKIEFTNDEVLFIAGPCYVPVSLQPKLLTQGELQRGALADYVTEVGTVRCKP
jgi:hypothetical protein